MKKSAAGTRRISPLKSALILLTVIGGTVALGALYLARVVPGMDAEMSGAGTTAMVLAVLFSFVVGGGLMALIFFSNRRGYDDNLARREDK